MQLLKRGFGGLLEESEAVSIREGISKSYEQELVAFLAFMQGIQLMK